MSIWIWIINGILWGSSICLLGIGSYKYLKGRRKLQKARWTVFSVNLQKTIDSYDEIFEKYNKMIANSRKYLAKHEKPEDIDYLQPIFESLKEEIEALADTAKVLKECMTQQVEYARKGGVALPEFINIYQIDATVEMATAAAVFALSGLFIGISAVLIALFG